MTLCPSFSGPVGSMIINKWGHRTCTIVGGILASAGIVLSSFATSVLYLILSFGILTGKLNVLLNLPKGVDDS